jgi:hypothetical protein
LADEPWYEAACLFAPIKANLITLMQATVNLPNIGLNQKKLTVCRRYLGRKTQSGFNWGGLPATASPLRMRQTFWFAYCR